MRLLRLIWLTLGGTIRCAACGHPVNNYNIVAHCRARHPEEMP